MKPTGLLMFLTVLSAGVLLWAQGDKEPSVVMAPVGSVQVQSGSSAQLNLDFRVGSEFHINSHTPHSELLIPTVLKFTPSEQVSIADVKYPPGQDMTFPFAPNEKLSVYSGDFSINTVVKAAANLAAGNSP